MVVLDLRINKMMLSLVLLLAGKKRLRLANLYAHLYSGSMK